MTSLLPLIIFGALVFLAVKAVRALFGQPAQPSWKNPHVPGGPRRPESGEDGFWLDTSSIPPGSTVRYRYFVQGRECTDSVVTQAGSRQYIYTGGVPTNIVVLETAFLASEAMRRPTITPSTPSTTHHPTPPTPSKFQGYPAAY